MEFKETNTGHWIAYDGADSYEIIRGMDKPKGLVYACFKNRVIAIAVEKALEQAIGQCENEQKEQQWLSDNPENKNKNDAARAVRDEEKRIIRDEEKPKRKRLYRGR